MSDFERHMSDSDALLWNIEKDPVLRSTITALTVLDVAPDWDRLVETIDRATRVIPRLRQRVVVPPLRMAPPRWTVDPHFDLGYHLRRVQAPAPGTFAQVLEITRAVSMTGFDRARPLWEFVLIEGLVDGRAALIQKLHHSITDGVGGIRLATSMLDLEREPAGREPMPALPELDERSLVGLVRESIAHNRRRALGIARRSARNTATGTIDAMRHPVATASAAGRTARSIGKVLAPATEPMSPLWRQRTLSARLDTLDVPLDDLKRAAKAVGGTLNDAFVAGVAGGLARYHARHGAPVDALRMTMPINLRTDDSAGGNQFVPARFPVPLAIADPAERMRVVSELVRRWRTEPALALTDALAGVLNRLPTSITTRVFGSMLKGVDFVTSNVPGVPIPVYLAGAELLAQYAFGPLSGAAINVVLLSHCGTCCLGINADAVAVPDLDVLRACLVESFDEVLAVGEETSVLRPVR